MKIKANIDNLESDSDHITVSHNNSDLRYNWQREEVLKLFDLSFNDLIFRAAQIHRKYNNPNQVQINVLLNIKTGACPENCKYCPQSAHYNTGLKAEPFMEINKVVEAAKKAAAAGASRFCMGAAWRNLHNRDLEKVCKMIEEVRKIGLETCVTLGMINKDQSKKLKDAGLDYYNHNIDTSPTYYKEIISTRSFEDRLDTLENVRQAGIKVCSGGIIGMGESKIDRAEMLITLANLSEHPQSVPINKLLKIPGTPLENVEDIDDFEFIKTIAVARIMMPKTFVRLSAGRVTLNEQSQALCFLAGANSIHYGDKLLVTKNNESEKDIKLFAKLGVEAV